MLSSVTLLLGTSGAVLVVTTTSLSTTTTEAVPGRCGEEAWKGDGLCDDFNNNPGCDFDGGDCCGDDVVTDYCAKCECLE